MFIFYDFLRDGVKNIIMQEEFLSTVQVLHGDSELAIVATLVEVSRSSRRRRSNILSDNINKTQSLVYGGKNLLVK